ncbi:unnamed protein product, partial [Callosobruchus maculatus]
DVQSFRKIGIWCIKKQSDIRIVRRASTASRKQFRYTTITMKISVFFVFTCATAFSSIAAYSEEKVIKLIRNVPLEERKDFIKYALEGIPKAFSDILTFYRTHSSTPLQGLHSVERRRFIKEQLFAGYLKTESLEYRLADDEAIQLYTIFMRNCPKINTHSGLLRERICLPNGHCFNPEDSGVYP